MSIIKQIKKPCAALALSAIALTTFNSNANATTFNISGIIDIEQQEFADFFGFSGPSEQQINISLDFDDSQGVTDAYSTIDQTNYQSARYHFNVMNISFGNKNWSYDAGTSNEHVQIFNATSSGSVDNVAVYANTPKNFAEGSIGTVAFSKYNLNTTTITDRDANNFNLFNTLINSAGYLRLDINGQNVTESIRRLSMEVSAVPLPAGVWLLGSAVVGFMGLRRRKKAVI